MAVNRSTLISAAAAHGITPRVVNSWLPSLLRWPRILVPVEVDALVLRPGSTETWANCQMKEPPAAVKGAPPNDSRSLLPDPFLELDPKRRTPGVYLHWALPDAITAGTQTYDPSQPNATRDTQFPVIPDRWLVMRIGPDATGGRRSVTGWVLQAESNPPNVIPLDGYTGMATDKSNHGRLTALGHGDPAWAAYFDNVENRLAFHDPLSADLPAGALAYLVCGWYSDPSDDPLAASETPTLAAFEARVRALGWQLDTSALDAAAKASRDHMSAAASYQLPSPLLGTVLDVTSAKVLLDAKVLDTNAATSLAGVAEYESADAWWPQQILCHGAAVGLGWPTDEWPGNTGDGLSTSAGGPPDAAAINVALAATSGEALGTIVANSSGRADDIRLVEAFSTPCDRGDRPARRASHIGRRAARLRVRLSPGPQRQHHGGHPATAGAAGPAAASDPWHAGARHLRRPADRPVLRTGPQLHNQQGGPAGHPGRRPREYASPLASHESG